MGQMNCSPVGHGGCNMWGSPGVLLVLFILLVIICRVWVY